MATSLVKKQRTSNDFPLLWLPVEILCQVLSKDCIDLRAVQALRLTCQHLKDVVDECLPLPKEWAEGSENVLFDLFSMPSWEGTIPKFIESSFRSMPAQWNSLGFRYFAWSGNVDAVQKSLCFRGVDPCANHDEAIRYAVSDGHIAVLELLLKEDRVYPFFAELLCEAIQYGQVKIVRILLKDRRLRPMRHPTARDNASFKDAVDFTEVCAYSDKVGGKDYAEIVKLLLKEEYANLAEFDNDFLCKLVKLLSS